VARYIFITGGVVSSLGKGIAAASLGAILQAKGYKVRIRKLDGYLNVDPGTMNPYEHGEVFGVQPQAKKPMVDQENLSTLRQIDAVTGSALSPDDVNDMFSRLNNAQSAEELMEMIYGTE
jgi:hypothetical protein